VEKWVDLLVPVVEDGLADDRIDADLAADLVDQLVEFNVDRQVEFLLGSAGVPDDAALYGFVYDFQGVYGDVRGRAYLVNADGETDPAALKTLVPASFEGHVRRLLA
jgi:carbonic anhydrase